jgi:hypothetical protein
MEAPASRPDVGLSSYAPSPSVSPAASALGAMATGSYGPDTIAGYSRVGLTPGIDRVADAISAVNPGLGINSGYRSPAKNAAVGGASKSQHIAGNALDVDISGLSDAQKAQALNAAVEGGARGIGLYSSGNVMHVDARQTPAVWGAIPGAAYKGMPVSMAPGWAQPGLQDMFAAGPFAVTPRNVPPTPTAKVNPDAPTVSAALAQALANDPNVPAQSVATTSFSPPSDETPSSPDTDDIGFFGGVPGQFAGVPAQSVQTTSISPAAAIASATPDTAPAYSSTQESPATKALDSLASKDNSFSEIAGKPTQPSNAYATTNLPGYAPQSTVAPSNAYATTNLPGYAPEAEPIGTAALATTNLPGYGYTAPSIDPVDVAVSPPEQISPPAISPQTFAPETVAPKSALKAPAPQQKPAAPSIPSGTQAALGFHEGTNNAAVASNGNLLTRDALGYSYNYSPDFDVTTISNPSGMMVGVKEGKVTADTAATSTNPSKGLFGLSQDNVSNAVMGGLGGLGGAVVGGMFGPVGSIIGSAIGRQLAVQNNPFATPGAVQANPGLLGTLLGGLGVNLGGTSRGGFPSAPTGPKGALGGTQSNRSMGEMRGMSPAAAGAIGRGQGGLY